MNPLDTLAIALGALGRNKTRSFLTILGVVIGVGSVILMVSIGEGAKQKVSRAFEAMGTTTLQVMSGSAKARGVRGGAGSQPSLTWEDLAAIRDEVAGVRAVAPELSGMAQAASDESNWQTRVTGTTPEYFEIRNWKLALGEPFTQSDLDAGAKVVVLGKTVATNLFGEGADPVGQTVRINRIPFQIVGVAAPKGATGFGDQDDRVIIPSSTFTSKISGGLQKYIAGNIQVAAASRAETPAVQRGIEELLRGRHRLRAGGDDDFFVRDPSESADAEQQSIKTISSLLFFTALVSLLIGGIGIMNIMLVSVTERTREIGLRMAVGAREANVLAQFLLEAIALSMAGGAIGIGAGVVAARVMASKLELPLGIRLDIVLVAVVVSALVGVVFGLYPARKASRLDPIAALRYE